MIYVIVPYRAGRGEEERAIQKESFTQHMRSFLPEATLVIAEQSQGKKFNRGALLNVAVKTINPVCGEDVLIFHDVDLLPSEDLKYAYLSQAPVMHIASVWKRYDSPSYLGGVLLVRPDVFSMINGFPNNFYGWGGEDDELRDRLIAHNVPILKAKKGTLTDIERMDLCEKLSSLRRKGSKCYDKRERRAEYKAIRLNRERVAGLREVQFRVEKKETDQFMHIQIYI